VKVNTGGSPGVGTGIGILAPLVPVIADQARAGSLLHAKKISERYDEQLKFVTRRGQPIKSVKAALIVPSETAPQISRSDAAGLHPRVQTDAEEPVKAHLVWDELVVPSGADDYEASRKK
ncbi:type VI secretion system tip protein VgrG, partial [Pseudomonas sp. GW460-C3]